MIYFGYFSFSTIHLELKRQIRSYAPVVPLKTIPILRPLWSKSEAYNLYASVKIYNRFQTKTAQKPYPLGRHIPI